VFTGIDPDPFIELEHVGALNRLMPGESQMQFVTWRLEKG